MIFFIYLFNFFKVFCCFLNILLDFFVIKEVIRKYKGVINIIIVVNLKFKFIIKISEFNIVIIFG